MAITIGRSWIGTDDDGSGETGTVINLAYIDAFLDAIDTALALALPLAGGAITGATSFTSSVALTSGQKLYLDGVAATGDTYISESAANTLSLFSGGIETKLVSGTLTVTGGQNKAHAMTGTLLLNANTSGAAQGFQIDGANLASGSNAVLVSVPTGWTGNLLMGTLNLVQKFAVSQTGAGSFAGGLTVTGAGIVSGSPTGGDKGAGTINATAVYDDNVLLTDWVFDLVHEGVSAHPVPVGGRLYTLDETRQATFLDRRLPWMPTRTEFDTDRHLGGMVTRLWFGQEQQQIYLHDLHARIAALEAAGV